MTDVPKWLLVMRSITGLTETPGDADNPKILAMAKYIAHKFPDMADYCAQYQHDSTAWCGLTAAFCMAASDIRPPFGPTDTDKFLWALSWKPWIPKGGKIIGSPVLGCMVVMEREGGGHITMYEKTNSNGTYACRGGNQSDAVNVANYDPSAVVALVWPVAAGDVPQIPVSDRPMLERGDSGPDVFDLQSMIPNFTDTVDGDFGPATEQNVTHYQASRGLEVDGVVGQETWQALYDNKPPLPPPEPPPGALTAKQQSDVKNIAKTSKIAKYSWPDRGVAPSGYTQGMALAFAQDCVRLKAKHPTVVEMAKARTNSDKDALNVYKNEFQQMGMSNERPGIDTLRHLYVMMLSSGMLESSGEHCCGRDQSASNVSSDTCEAGLFQTSYNASGASDPEFDDTMDEFMANHGMCYLDDFAQDVSCSESDWENYGSGRGFQFQQLCKNCPMFAVETHGLTLRNLCNHYGPCNRGEYVLKTDADAMFHDVQDYIEGQPVAA